MTFNPRKNFSNCIPAIGRTNCKIQRNIGNQHNDCSSIKETNIFWRNFG